MTNNDFDAIVIGSGISGGWAAKELTEKGMKVLMLDRGRMVEHRKDYITEGKGPWQLAYRGNLPPAEVERDYVMAKWGGANLTAQTHYYNNDRLNPIDFENSKPFRWVRPNQVVANRSSGAGWPCAGAISTSTPTSATVTAAPGRLPMMR